MVLLEILVAIVLAVPCALWLLRRQRTKHGQGKMIPLLPERCTFFGGHLSWLSEEIKKAGGVRVLPLHEAFMKHKLAVFDLRLGPVFQIGPVGRKVSIISDSTLAEEIIKSKDFGLNKDLAARFAELVGGQSVATIDGEEWKRHRRLMEPIFYKEHLAHSMEVIRRRTNNYLEDLRQTASIGELDHDALVSSEPKTVNLVDTFTLLAMDIIAEVGFNYNLHDQPEEKRAAFRKALDTFVGQFAISAFHPSMTLYRILHPKKYQEFVGHREFLRNELIGQIIKLRQDAMRRGEATPQDLLSLLLNAKDNQFETGDVFSEEEVINNAFTIFGGGFEYPTSALSWLFYYLAKHPKVQERVYSEVTEVGSEDIMCSSDGIEKLTYLSWVINEVQRLEPVAGFTERGSLRDTVVQGYYFPAGSDATINIYAIHHSPDEWDEPENFKPERWEKPDGGCKKSSAFAFLPFGAGARRCLGQPLALLEMKLIAALFVSKFRVILADEDCKREMPFSYHPGQVLVKLEPR